eukprot:3625125-Pyramimonas_sp.AAC.1
MAAPIAASISRIYACANDADVVRDPGPALIDDLRQFFSPRIDAEFAPAPDCVRKSGKQGASRACPEIRRFLKGPAEPEDSP